MSMLLVVVIRLYALHTIPITMLLFYWTYSKFHTIMPVGVIYVCCIFCVVLIVLGPLEHHVFLLLFSSCTVTIPHLHYFLFDDYPLLHCHVLISYCVKASAICILVHA